MNTEAVELLRNMSNCAKEVMSMLQLYGPSIVRHLIDTDENEGQRLRELVEKSEAFLARVEKEPETEPCEHPKYKSGMISCPDCGMVHLLMQAKEPEKAAREWKTSDVVGYIRYYLYGIPRKGLPIVFSELFPEVQALLRGQERDLTPEEAQIEVTNRFGQGSSVQVDFEVNSDWTWTKNVILYDWENEVIAEANTFREAFTNADADAKEVGK